MDLIGQMRKVVKLCINIPDAQGAGFVDNYGIFLETRGKLSQDSGNRQLVSAELEGTRSYTLITRFQQSIEINLSVSAKWLIDGVFYTIDSWSKIDEETKLYYKFRVNKKEPPAGAVPSLIPIGTVGLHTLNLSQDMGNSVDMGITPDEIILVTRSGVLHSVVAGVPGALQVQQQGTLLVFQNEFNPGGEPVFVLYKQNG